MTVASDCEESAFFIRVFIEENGEAYNLTETITSINHLDKNYKPGERLTIDLKTPPIGFTVKKATRSELIFRQMEEYSSPMQM